MTDELFSDLKRVLASASDEERWRLIGRLVELRIEFDLANHKNRGRPMKNELDSIDCFRAFQLWRIAQKIPIKARRTITNRRLIEIAAAIETSLNLPLAEQSFPKASNVEASVSRGKGQLEIGPDWSSALCEKIESI